MRMGLLRNELRESPAPNRGILGHENKGLRLEIPIFEIILSEYQ
jgi:hypothetical protein